MPVVSSNEIHVKYTLDVGQLQAATAAMSQITAEERKLLADLKKLQDQLNNTGRAGKGAGDSIAGSLGNVGSVVKQLIPVFSVAFAIDKLKQFSLYAFETAKQFEQMTKTLAFVTGSSQKANEQLSYMTALSQTLGLNVRSLSDGFKGFAAAASFAGVSQENINRQMVGFTKAAAALSLSAEDTKLMFNALSQMYSKNKIQAEELRGQLGERLPGAMELLAKSMGKPVTALDEMLKKGEIITKDVMPAFAKEVELAFGMAAAQTDTLTAAQNRMMTAFETAAVRIMEGGIGDMIKFIMNRLAAISDFIKWLNQNTAENLEDFFNKRKANVQQNVLFEIEAERKRAKEKEGIELTAAQAAERILNDERRGYAAHAKFIKDVYAEAFEEAGQKHKNKLGLLGMIDDIKRFSAKAGAVTKGFANTLISPLEVLSRGGANVLRENITSAINVLNKETQAQVDLSKERINSLNYFSEKAKQDQKVIDEEAADEAAKSAKNRYQKELQMLELQERIRKFYAEASIEDEFARSQELLKIAAAFNEKKKSVDLKYFKESFANESQGMKDLRELTKNNADLRVAESASMYADLERNDIKYHKEAYEKEKKALDKLQNERDKNAEKQQKKRDLTFDEEMALIDKKYQEMTDAAVQNAKNIINNDALLDSQRKQLLEQNYALLNQIYNDKNDERNEFQRRSDEQFLKDAEKFFAELEKLRKEDFERAKSDQEAQARLTATNMETQMLAEKNALRGRGRPGDPQEMALLEKKQSEQRIQNQIDTLQQQYDLNRTFADVESGERKKEQDQILADMRSLEEQKTQIAMDYADQRRQYEAQVLQASLDLANQITQDVISYRVNELDNELAAIKRNADEQIRLADGNQQTIMAIEQRTRDKEKSIREEQFKAQQTAAVAEVVFRTAPIIAQYAAGAITAPLAIIAAAAAAAQIAAIMAQPVPEYRKGTRGKAHKGGPAIVGEEGVEKVVTESGRVYYTPPTATLLDLPKGAQVIPNNMLDKQEVYWATNQSKNKATAVQRNGVEVKLDEIGGILKSLPIHQINMDERGFEKFVRTERRTTKILNNRFPGKTR